MAHFGGDTLADGDFWELTLTGALLEKCTKKGIY
jgi:hypothetical protein